MEDNLGLTAIRATARLISLAKGQEREAWK